MKMGRQNKNISIAKAFNTIWTKMSPKKRRAIIDKVLRFSKVFEDDPKRMKVLMDWAGIKSLRRKPPGRKDH